MDALRVREIARAIEKFIENCPFAEEPEVPSALRTLADEHEECLRRRAEEPQS